MLITIYAKTSSRLGGPHPGRNFRKRRLNADGERERERERTRVTGALRELNPISRAFSAKRQDIV